MLRFLRNAIMTAAMAVAVVVVAWSFDLEAIQASLPTTWASGLKEALSINFAMAVGVFCASLALSFLLQSLRPKTWVISFGAFWCLLALFPNVTWVTRSHAPSGLSLGAMLAWGPLAILFATLLALRLASVINKLRAGGGRGLTSRSS